MKGTWQTTSSGGDGIGTVALVVLAAIVVAAVAGPVVHAAAELVRLVVIAAAIIAGLALAAAVALVAWRLRRRRLSSPLVVHQAPPVTYRSAESLPAPQSSPAAIPAPQRQAEVHLHFHGVDAAEVAAILAERSMPPIPPARLDDSQAAR